MIQIYPTRQEPRPFNLVSCQSFIVLNPSLDLWQLSFDRLIFQLVHYGCGNLLINFQKCHFQKCDSWKCQNKKFLQKCQNDLKSFIKNIWKLHFWKCHSWKCQNQKCWSRCPWPMITYMYTVFIEINYIQFIRQYYYWTYHLFYKV